MFAKSRILSTTIIVISVLSLFLVAGPIQAAPLGAPASQTGTSTLPVVAIHVSELTQALETMPASPPTPTGSGTTGFQWWPASWHYFVMHESLKEALRSDGTPFVEVTDADISAGQLLTTGGSPKYPIVISLASEAIRNDEVAPLRNYVAAGGFLFVGSSSFTRNPDGTTRGDFALAAELGLHMANASLQNWYQNMTFSKVINHRLVTHIPAGDLSWRMPLTAEEIPWGITPTHLLHGLHDVWQVSASDATIVANGNQGPILTTKSYGAGHLIYHGAMQPLIGHGGVDSGMYAYGIYRNAIVWAFESANLPIVKLSPWQYPYDAAFMVRHDAENNPSLITAIKTSAQFENSVGAKGDYYLTTGTLRANSEDTQLTEEEKIARVVSLQQAVELYGATIGSHNGGLGNPVVSVPALLPSSYDYWHWGPDEALDTTPAGYANGKAYAYASISTSFQDIEGWLAGRDNGRAGCGAAHNCPRTWAAPYFNGAREDSNDIVEQLGAITTGEQKIGPFPHRTLSYNTPGKRFAQLTLPVSEWYAGTDVVQVREYHTSSSIHAAIDFYYDLGALINIYGHEPTDSNVIAREYVTYGMSKPRVWATNAVGVYDWWASRSGVTVTPSYTESGETATASATIAGATDSNTAIEVVIPNWEVKRTGSVQVLLNGAPANPTEYRATSYGLKVRVGTTVSNVQVNYSSVLQAWTQSDWSGGPGQGTWLDSTRYQSASGIDNSIVGQMGLSIASSGNVLLTDDFARPPYPSPAPFTWVIPTTSPPNAGAFDTSSASLHTSAAVGNYGFAYNNTVTIANHSVEADIRFPQANTFGGGIFGRLNATNGQRYAAWLYPEGSPGVAGGYGPAMIRLIKFHNWGDWDGVGLQTVSVPALGSGWHHLRLTFNGDQIQVFYDGSATPIINVTDTNADGFGPYPSGYVGVDLFTSGNTNGPTFDNYTVRDISNTVVLSDNFGVTAPDALLPWVAQVGTWTVSDGILQGSGSTGQYANAHTTTVWTDFSVEGRIQLPAGGFGGGGIGGRVDPMTGARYAAWISPAGSSGGSNVIKLIKFHDWTTWSGTPMQQVGVLDVGSAWHTLKMALDGNRIRVYYDGNQVIDVTDTGYDSRPAYASGGVSVDMLTDAATYVMLADDVVVRSPVAYTNSGTLMSSAFDGGTGAQWQTVSWDAVAGGSTSVRVRTRTANQPDQLGSAPWSAYYTISGSQMTSPDARWIQYELELVTSAPSTSPILSEIRISYIPAATPAASVSISASAPGILLSWQPVPGATEYQVYGSVQPYFTPIPSPAPSGNLLSTVGTATSYADSSSRSVFFYLVRSAIDSGGSSDSNRVGRFTFAIVPGTSP